MAKTQDELVARVLSLLGAANGAETPSTEDSTLVEGMIEPKIAELAARDVYYVSDPDSIEDEAFHWLAMLLAQDLALDFGAKIDGTAIALAEARLRHIKGTGDAGGVLRVEYF